MVGKTLGHYEILDPLGKGGMGEVYRARDTKLNRDVAIKVLPEELNADPDRLARLEREAHLLAALNHPNIATIHALEEDQGARFLVLELVKGESLEQRLAKGALPVEKALELCKQIAEALEAAHGEGIIHRDLKPANVLITPDGRAKVLDFGIAKSMKLGDDVVSDTAKATNLTVAGTLVGTPAYMSPEQVRGAAIDKRADIWAFGCLLFEMLTGTSAFGRETLADSLAAIVEQEPDWERLPSVHPRIRMLFERCLEKETRDRYHDIADARVDIQEALPDPQGQLGNLPGTTAGSPQRTLARMVASAVVTAFVAASIAWIFWPSASTSTSRFSIVLPESHVLSSNGWPQITVSPDGSSIVYAANNQLFLRPTGEWPANPIPGVEGQPAGPFFSHDGRFVGYWDRGDEELRRIPIEGGTPVRLDDVANLLGARWNAEDTIIYAKLDGIWSIPGEGGNPQQLVAANPGERMHAPQMLPNGTSVLFTLLTLRSGRGLWEGAEIVVHDLDAGTREVIVTGEDGRYLPTGHLVYALENTLFAVPFDAESKRRLGGAISVVEQVRPGVNFGGNTATRNWDFSSDGMLVYAAGREEMWPVGSRELVIVDLAGAVTPVTDVRRDYWRPKVSPDGEKIGVQVFDGSASRIWIVEVATGEATQLTFDGLNNEAMTWTRDGRSILYYSLREEEGESGIYMKAADGREEPEALGAVGSTLTASLDGTLAYQVGGEGAERRIGTLDLADPAGTAEIILDNEATLNMPAISPDGRYLAYTSDGEIWVSPYPINEGSAMRVSEVGGTGAVWSVDSSRIYYRGAGSIRVEPNPLAPPSAATRRGPLFEYQGIYRISGNVPAFDVFPDGERFAMVTLGDPPTPHPRQINVVLNWFEELKRRVPVGDGR